jgi:hypothetical protein
MNAWDLLQELQTRKRGTSSSLKYNLWGLDGICLDLIETLASETAVRIGAARSER